MKESWNQFKWFSRIVHRGRRAYILLPLAKSATNCRCRRVFEPQSVGVICLKYEEHLQTVGSFHHICSHVDVHIMYISYIIYSRYEVSYKPVYTVASASHNQPITYIFNTRIWQIVLMDWHRGIILLGDWAEIEIHW